MREKEIQSRACNKDFNVLYICIQHTVIVQ